LVKARAGQGSHSQTAQRSVERRSSAYVPVADERTQSASRLPAGALSGSPVSQDRVLARDPAWTTWVGNLAVRAIGAWQAAARRAEARPPHPRRPARSRSSNGSATGHLNVHFHLLVPDGVFVDDEDRLVFALHPVPTSANVVAILDRMVRRIARRLAAEARDDAKPPSCGTIAVQPPSRGHQLRSFANRPRQSSLGSKGVSTSR